jgi:hypothetical protein
MLAVRQTVRARQADRQTAVNDTLLAVAQAYFNVQQAFSQLARPPDNNAEERQKPPFAAIPSPVRDKRTTSRKQAPDGPDAARWAMTLETASRQLWSALSTWLRNPQMAVTGRTLGRGTR